MNPDTNKFEELVEAIARGAPDDHNKTIQKMRADFDKELVRPNGEPVPKHWSVFQEGEHVVVKDYTFKVAYIGESTLLLEPVGPVIVGK